MQSTTQRPRVRVGASEFPDIRHLAVFDALTRSTPGSGRPWRAQAWWIAPGAFQLDGKRYRFAGAAVPTLIAALAFRLLS